MNKKNILWGLFMAILSNSCSTKSDNEVIINEFNKFGSTSINHEHTSTFDTIRYSKNLTVFLEYKNDDLKKIKSSLINHVFGHNFIFDENGKLQNYFFLIDSIHSSIEITKNSFQNKMNEKGSPFVDYLETETNDTIKKYTFLFSEFPRNNINVWISFDGNKYENLSLKKSKLMPFLKELDINTNKKIIFLKIEATKLFIDLKGLDKTRLIYDTIRF